MENRLLLDENWHVLLSLFPPNWKELAKTSGAMVRKLRNFASEESVMRTLLLHIAQGYSLRETVVKAKAANIADVSDVALLKRLRLSENWFKLLCQSLLQDRGVATKKQVASNIRMRLVDATNVKEPGKTGSLWRIHYSLSLPDLQCDYFKLTGTEGKGTGETFKHFPIKKGDCIVGDRGYSTSQGISYIHKQKAYSLVRVNSTALKLYMQNDNKPFDLLSKIKKIKIAGKVGEWKVNTKKDDGGTINGRVCVIRKSEEAIQQALKKLQREAAKRQSTLKPETKEFAKYVIVFTTLPKKGYQATSVLEWYRLRWQIELIFKRLKSLAGLGHLPKYDEVSARAWLYGKLFTGLLVEKLIRYASEISPWGYCL